MNKFLRTSSALLVTAWAALAVVNGSYAADQNAQAAQTTTADAPVLSRLRLPSRYSTTFRFRAAGIQVDNGRSW